MPETSIRKRASVTDNPLKPPDLMDLVHRFDGYNKIPPEAWAAYDAELKAYKRAIANGDGWRPRQAD